MEFVKIVSTAFLSAATLFIIAKITGHKQMSQLDFFDYITGITIGSIAAELATELENPLYPLIAMVVYGIITFVLTQITSRFPTMRKYVNGTPTILMNNGKIYRKNLKKAKLDLTEFMVMCRQEGYFNLKDIRTAIFEYNGRLTVLPVTTKRPATPEDLNIIPKPEHIMTEFIMDGKVLTENLKRRGLDNIWLQKELAMQGYRNPKQIFLCLCDEENQLTVFEGE